MANKRRKKRRMKKRKKVLLFVLEILVLAVLLVVLYFANILNKIDFENMTDKDHLQNITKNPVNFLKQSGKGFFVDKKGYLIALKDEMQAVLQEGGTRFADEIRDIRND